MKNNIIFVSGWILLVSIGSAWANDKHAELDQVLGGFDEETAKPIESTERSHDSVSWLDIGLVLKMGVSSNFTHDAPDKDKTDYRGLSRLKTQLSLDAQIKLYKSWRAKIAGHLFYDFAYLINGRDEYTDQVIDAYEKEFETDEIYLQGSALPWLDIKLGNQIVAWGKSENIRITDVLNPLDNREPGVVDIDVQRLPVFMSKLDLYLGDWNLSGIVVHKVRFNKDPVFGSDFYPSSEPALEEETLEFSVNNQEYAVALNGIFSGWDLSFYGAYYFDEQAHLEVDNLSATQMRQIRKHSRVSMAGISFDIALGSWLLKSELAYLHGLEFFALPGEKKSRLDMLVGVTYSGLSETLISIEIANRHLFGFEELLGNKPDFAFEDDLQFALRVTREFLHDRLLFKLIIISNGLLGENGALERFDLTFDWTDNLSTTIGLVLYQSGNKQSFSTIGDNDRIFAELRLSY